MKTEHYRRNTVRPHARRASTAAQASFSSRSLPIIRDTITCSRHNNVTTEKSTQQPADEEQTTRNDRQSKIEKCRLIVSRGAKSLSFFRACVLPFELEVRHVRFAFWGMLDGKLQVLGVVGSLNQNSVTRIVIQHLATHLQANSCAVDIFDPVKEQLGLFNPDSSYTGPGFAELQKRVEAADVLLLGTPDYHGSVSSTLKNFLDHFWEEFAGKLFATVVASHEKGLTVTDQLRTVARQCYAWSMPYGVSFNEREDLKDGIVSSETLKKRLDMLVNDICNYGRVITEQRFRDLNGNEPSFLARYRAKR